MTKLKRVFINQFFLFSPFNIVLSILFFLNINVSAQPKKNLDIFYSFIDSSVNSIVKSIPADTKDVIINTVPNNAYSIFDNRIYAALAANNKQALLNDESAKTKIKLIIDEAKVLYPEAISNGLFGSLKVKRNISLSGNYCISNSGIVQKAGSFNYSLSDTVAYNQLAELENNEIAFTKNEKPEEPFLSGLVEPAIAICSAATIIYLFFTVRSK